MERALILTAVGGVSLYLISLLVSGSGYKPVPAVSQVDFGGEYTGSFAPVSSSTRLPISDPSKEPRPSGSASSIVTALASAVGDPTTTGRATELGGDAASTGDQHPPTTHGSMEEEHRAPRTRRHFGPAFAETAAALHEDSAATGAALDKIDLYHTDASNYVPP